MTYLTFASAGSGSSGNATLVRTPSTCLLVDCGFSVKELTKRLAELALLPESIDAIFVTHEHADHIRGVGALARKYRLPVYLTAGTFQTKALGLLPNPTIIAPGQKLTLGDIQVDVNGVPHDAREPVQFVFTAHHKRLGILTDAGSIPEALVQAYLGLDALIIEANHDPEMLARGPYPSSLKQRVGGHWGHLSNQQCADLVSQQDHQRLQHLVIAHISQKNNCPIKVKEALSGYSSLAIQPILACQESGFDWLTIA